MTNHVLNCTFSRNDTVVDLCCAPGNSTTPNSKTSSCNTTDDDFWPCVQNQGLRVSCMGEGIIVSAASKRAFFVSKLLVLVTLLFMTNVVRADSTFTVDYVGFPEPKSPVAKPLVAPAPNDMCDQDPGCDDPCITYSTSGNIADYKVFSDSNCKDQIDNPKIAIPCAPLAVCARSMLCAGPMPGSWPNPVYVQPGRLGFDFGGELVFTKGQHCFQGGAAAAVAVISARSSCVQLQGVTSDWGMSYFRCGSSGLVGRDLVGQGNVTHPVEEPVGRRAATYQGRLEGRGGGANCKSFDMDPREKWIFDAYTPSKRVSQNVGCTQSKESCAIGKIEQWTETWTTTWQTTVTVSVDPFSVAASVGGSYAQSVSSSISVGSSIPSGQTGYLSAYSNAVAVTGWFRDCDDGKDYYGSALVPSTHITYEVILV